MIKREFKAKIADDFKNKWAELAAIDEGISINEALGYYNHNNDLNNLSDRISGEIVTITHNTYSTGEDDYFESIDNNFVIFPELFKEIK